jgi:dipeptidyl aminopeptidase/acylaminoacyl peptidase
MFTTLGPHAFEGRVFVARPDGTRVTAVLSPQTSLGYLAAYGNSLKDFLLVSADQSTGSNTDVVNITEYTPTTGKFIPLQQQLPAGQEESGVLSPDNTQFVAGIGAPGTPQLNLWVSNFKTKQYRQLTQGPDTDINVSWSPDGQQIAFIRLTQPLTTQLMTITASGGQPVTLLGSSEGIVGTAYSPDGSKLAFVSINGLETIDVATMQRSVIVPFDTLYGKPIQRTLEARGMSWARTQGKIVLVMLDRATNRDQLWTVSSDGTNLQKVYEAADGVIVLSVTFILN